MTGFLETLLAVAVIAIGIVFGGIVVLVVGHTIALLLWMGRDLGRVKCLPGPRGALKDFAGLR